MKPTPRDVRKGIEQSDFDDEMDRVLAMTPEPRRKELEAAGYDTAELHADADAVHAKMVRAALDDRAKRLETDARMKSMRPRARPRPLVLWVAAVAMVAVAGGVVYAMLAQEAKTRPPSTASTAMPPPPEDLGQTDLRREAFAACAAKRWTECLARFDAAKQADPAGDAVPEAQQARREASRAIGEGEKPKP